MNDDNQSRVMTAIWPWRDKGKDAKPENIRLKSLIEAAVTTCVGLLILLVLHHRIMATIVFCVAGLVLIGGQLIPPLYHGFKKFGAFLAKIVGVGLSWLLLAPFFYICFTTGRLCVVFSGKDPLNRAFPAKGKTCWVPRSPVPSLAQYSRQY